MSAAVGLVAVLHATDWRTRTHGEPRDHSSSTIPPVPHMSIRSALIPSCCRHVPCDELDTSARASSMPTVYMSNQHDQCTRETNAPIRLVRQHELTAVIHVGAHVCTLHERKSTERNQSRRAIPVIATRAESSDRPAGCSVGATSRFIRLLARRIRTLSSLLYSKCILPRSRRLQFVPWRARPALDASPSVRHQKRNATCLRTMCCTYVLSMRTQLSL